MSAYTNVMVHPASLKLAGKWVQKQMKELKADLMIGTGTSGISVGAVASVLTDKLYLHVRKEGESSHGYGGEVIYPSGAAGDRYELRKTSQRVVIIDDFISGGGTVERLVAKVVSESSDWTIVAILLYSDYHKDYGTFRETGIPIRSTHITPRSTLGLADDA